MIYVQFIDNLDRVMTVPINDFNPRTYGNDFTFLGKFYMADKIAS